MESRTRRGMKNLNGKRRKREEITLKSLGRGRRLERFLERMWCVCFRRNETNEMGEREGCWFGQVRGER